MNDRYHAFGRQGFGAIYGSKNLKAIVVAGTGEVPIARPDEFKAICKRITDEYKTRPRPGRAVLRVHGQAEELARLDVPADDAARA